jgi:hypothetical protein
MGVRTYVRHKCFRGYTLFSTAFGNTEYLIDMNGMVVHAWPVSHSQYAELLPNGDLMVDNYDAGLEVLDPKGNRLWLWEGNYHHDFHVVGDDEIAFLVYRNEPPVPELYAPGYVPTEMRNDVAMGIDRSGKVLWEFPLLDHIQELHDLAGLPLPMRFARLGAEGQFVEYAQGDWTHTNTLEVLPETPLGRRDPRFRAGNILLSFRSLDIIAVADIEKDAIVWAWGLGELDGQHQPTMTPEGTLLLFDNGTTRGWSRVMEIDPPTGALLWKYENRADFFSAYRSGAQRLPNGNTLIAESDAGRILEVTHQGEIVWEYHNPYLGLGSGVQGRHVYRATRYTDEQVRALFDTRRDERVVGVATDNHIPVETFADALRFYRDGLGG